jgi:predicted  nucleic acid-binding Zn-ribbon protein
MGKRGRSKKIDRSFETGISSDSQRAKVGNIDFATGWNTKPEKKEHEVQAESSKDHAPSDTNLPSKRQTSNEERRDEIAHPESGLWNASGNESLSQDSSVPDSPIDPPHLFESVQELEKDACNKKELFFNTRKECESINKQIIRLKKERAALKKEYKPQTTEMKKLKSKIEKQEQKREELTLQLSKMIDKYTHNITEIIHMADQSEFLREGVKEEYEIKKSILEYLEDEMREKRMQKANFNRKLDEIIKLQDKIDKSKEYKIRQEKISNNEKWIMQLEEMKEYLIKDRDENSEYKKSLEQMLKELDSVEGLRVAKADKLSYNKNRGSIAAKASLTLKYAYREIGDVSVQVKITENKITNIDSMIKQIEIRIKTVKEENKRLNEANDCNRIIDENIAFNKGNNISENNINFYEQIGNGEFNYFRNLLEIIKCYDRNTSKKTGNNIKDFESKYEKLQNSMCSIEEQKEAAEQSISQYQLDHWLYLIDRKRLIREYQLEGKAFLQNEEINIQNHKLDQEDYSKYLRAEMERLYKDCEKQKSRMEVAINVINGTSAQIREYLENKIASGLSSKNPGKVPFNCGEAEKDLDHLYRLRSERRKKFYDIEAKKRLEITDEIERCRLKILKIVEKQRDYLLKEIEDYQLAKSNLKKEVDARLKIIESQFNTDLRNLQHVHDEKQSELERLRSELEDREKKTLPETQQQKLQGQFNKQINKIQSQEDAIGKELEMGYKRLKEIKNELGDYEQKREPLTIRIKDHQDKLKEEKKKLEIANAEWLKIRIAAEEAHSSLESSIIERTRNSMERRNVRKTSGEICPISHGLRGDTKNSTSEYLGEVANMENDYGIINAYNEDIKIQHEKLDKLNQSLINLYERQKILKRCIMQNKIKIGSIYRYKHKLEDKSLEQLAILNNRKEEYAAIKQVFSKLDEEYHDCLKTCEAVGNVIAILNSEISAEEEGQKKLTSQSDEINTKPEQLNALDSQSHTTRQQSEVSAQEAKDLLKKYLAASDQKKIELEEKVGKSREELEKKKKQLDLVGSEWIETGKTINKSRHRIVSALAEKYELIRRLAKVQKDIEAIESNKFYNKIESNKIIRNVQKLFEKDNPTVPDSSQEESNKPSKSKSILKKPIESQEDQGRQVKQVRSADSEMNTSQTASQRLKDPLQAREEVEKAHTDPTLHSQEQSSSELASRVDSMTIASQNASWYERFKALTEAVDDAITMATPDDEDRIQMIEAKITAQLYRKDWRLQWITKRPWN